jgi:ABC-2 type transport system ATP-binding protein
MAISTALPIKSNPLLNDATIQIRGLFKYYGKTVAIRGMSLEVRRGELFGLIGADGAGKTTTFNILGGVIEATAGKIQILGLSARDARSNTGYLTQQFSLYPDLSVDENIYYSAGLRLVPENQLEVIQAGVPALLQRETMAPAMLW